MDSEISRLRPKLESHVAGILIPYSARLIGINWLSFGGQKYSIWVSRDRFSDQENYLLDSNAIHSSAASLTIPRTLEM